ncbi:MAG: hypothetical protein EBR02_06470 [Alphaproteobacteria bacterium]|nr:hypothetical protein [Alphaproteobacteria bacterium]
MAKTAQKEYSMEDLEQRYNEVTKLYDLAEEVLSTVESSLVSDPEQQLAMVEPLVNEVGDAVDVLAEEFLLIAESKKNKTSTRASKKNIEGALRRVFVAIADYQARVSSATKKAHGSIMNIADPLVKKLRRQVEQVVVVFLEFIQISLQSILNKHELDALKQRDSRVALMMHQMTLAQQG